MKKSGRAARKPQAKEVSKAKVMEQKAKGHSKVPEKRRAKAKAARENNRCGSKKSLENAGWCSYGNIGMAADAAE